MSAVRELVQGERRGRWLVAAVACAAAMAWAAAPARAVDAVIPGNPLTIYANDNGQLQVVFGDSTTGEFFPPSAAPANAGLNVAQTPAGTTPYTVFGFQGSTFLPNTAPTVAGSGTTADPWVLTTTFRTGPVSTNPALRVDERLTYVNGTTDVGVQYTLVNESDSQALDLRAYEAADLFVAGNDTGVGFFDQGVPRQIGGINEAAGSSGRLVEQSPAWAHYQEGRYTDVFSVVGDAGAFSDTIDPTLLDNGVGVQWDVPSLALGASRTFNVVWRFRRFVPLTLALTAATKAQGQLATATVTARNSDGNAAPGRPVLYAITGANPGAGALTTGADGTATITWAGANLGTDTLTAFIDTNANGVRDADEPAQTADVAWTLPPPPVPGKSVVVKVVSGTVTVKYPPGYTPRAASPRAAGFVPFKGAANIPVGSQLDTSLGRVALTSAADTGGAKTQTSDFYQGIFQVKQTVPKKKPKKPAALTTDLVMKGQIARSQCAPLKGRALSRGRRQEEEGTQVGPREAVGQRQGQVPHERQVQLRDGARDDLAGRGSLRGHADEGHARDGPGARPAAQEDRDGEGRPQLPRARPAGGQQDQAALTRSRIASDRTFGIACAAWGRVTARTRDARPAAGRRWSASASR